MTVKVACTYTMAPQPIPVRLPRVDLKLSLFISPLRLARWIGAQSFLRFGKRHTNGQNDSMEENSIEKPVNGSIVEAFASDTIDRWTVQNV